MPSTCRAYDCSAPEIVQEAIRRHLKEPHLNTHMCCMVGDVGGERCNGLDCSFAGRKGKKIEMRGPVKLRQNDSVAAAGSKVRKAARPSRRRGTVKATSQRK